MRRLDTLHMPSSEIFGRVVEGMCPGCGRALERRTLKLSALSDRADPALECGWCVACEWGWSAWTYRGEPGQWQPGEHLTTVYAEGALVTSNAEPRLGEDHVEAIVEDFPRFVLNRWT